MKNYLTKNILMVLGLLIATGSAWYFCLCLAFAEIDSGFLLLLISLLYMGATVAYAVFADKWWNIPCMLYMAFMMYTSVLHISDSLLADDLIILAFPPVIGLNFITSLGDAPFSIIVIIFNLSVLLLALQKYLPGKKKQ